MMKPIVVAAVSAFAASVVFAQEVAAENGETMTFTANRIAVDNVMRTAVATGHVHAVSKPMVLRGEYMEKDANGRMFFGYPTCATTCSNEVGNTHWNVTGEVEYQEHEYVILRNAWLSFYEVPIFWLPYMYYPLETDCGFSWMPGYIGSWGAYLLTKYTYHLVGDQHHQDNTWWLAGDTRFDLRYIHGVAAGEDLEWNLGEFGGGKFQLYYAWDVDAEDEYGVDGHEMSRSQIRNLNWGSTVDEQRYMIGFTHKWNATERDVLRVKGAYYSDSYFRNDFFRRTLFNSMTQWLGYDNSGVFWEHLENSFSIGAEVSGRLNKFYSMTGRLPEMFLDVNPQPILDLPINYESENRIGYLNRNPAEYGNGNRDSAYAFNPGLWAEYDVFRLDTYHRISAPFRAVDDVLAINPRIGYRGTYWSESGHTDLTGWNEAENAGSVFRSILEGGVTFASRGTAWMNDRWQHMVEPYTDVLVQKAWFSGIGNGNRPYVFDSVDASSIWEDQFAGRSRNLPYSYYGITPGLRNAWSMADDRGGIREVVDFDIYAALQCNSASYIGDNDAHKLSEVGDPNYGKNGCFVSPGARIRWRPDDDLTVGSRVEYDSDNNRLSFADAGLRQRVSQTFSYNVQYTLRDYRYWDFSSYPYSSQQMTADEFNYARMHYIHLGFEQQPIDWLAWGPFLRWDIRSNELDSVGTWIDYLTDCLGFRFIVEYQNSFMRIDGYEHDDNWSFGFYIYLRAFGADSGNVFMGN